MKNILLSSVTFLAISVVSTVCAAEDLDVTFSRVKEFVAAKNFAKALDELQWAEKEIQKMNSAYVQSFFPDQLAGFTGGKAEATNAMGISNVERTYKSGAQSVKVSLTGGAGGAGLGGLAALGKMAAMFGGETGSETIRIAGRTAQLQSGEGNDSLTVFLDSGSMLKFETVNGQVETATLKAFAEAMQIDALDNYLRGIVK